MFIVYINSEYQIHYKIIYLDSWSLKKFFRESCHRSFSRPLNTLQKLSISKKKLWLRWISLVARCVTVPRRASSNASRSDSNVNPRFSTPSYWELKLLERISIWVNFGVERYVIPIYIARFPNWSSFLQFVYRIRWYFIFVF